MRRLATLLLMSILSVMTCAEASDDCPAIPHYNIDITPQSVSMRDAAKTVTIDNQGQVRVNGKPVAMNALTQQQATQLQSQIRRQLPEIKQGVQQKLAEERLTLDKIITQDLGADSHLHQRLSTLQTQLQHQLSKVITQKDHSLQFNYLAIEQTKKETQALLRHSLGAMVQDGLNESGRNALSDGSLSFKTAMNNLGRLQQSLQQQLEKNKQAFNQFGKKVCNDINSIEKQRRQLYRELTLSY